MRKGTVKFFNHAKGFGFIAPSDQSEDVFVHGSNLIDDIKDNEKVQYEVEQGRKGLSAINVELIEQ
jgi:CspA family cold shock protein